MNLLRRFGEGLLRFFMPQRQSAYEGPQQVLNRTRGTILATQLEIAGTGSSRNKGLLGRESLLPGEGLWIVPCEAVHTFFMRFPIDLVYLDRQHHIKKVRSDVGAWRLSVCLTAHSVVELPAGTIRETRTERGDAVEIASSASS